MKISYFETVSFWLANFIVSESQKNHLIKDHWLKESVSPLISLGLSDYVGKFGEIISEENRNVLGHSFYHDMFTSDIHSNYFLPKIQDNDIEYFTSGVEIYKRVLLDKLTGKEGGYISGGLLKDGYIGPVFPSTLYYVLNTLNISQNDLLEALLPDRILVPKSPKTGNSRTLGTLAAVVLGFIDQLDNVRSIVVSESSVGKLRWSKVVRYKMKKINDELYNYTYLETGLFTRSEIDAMYHRVGKSPVQEINEMSMDYPFEVNGEPFYILLREYTLGIFKDEKITDLKLHLTSLRLIKPEELSLK